MRFLKTYRRVVRRNKTLHIIIVAVAVILFWRGIWGLIDHYFLPDNLLLSNLLSIAIALLILLLDDVRLRELE